MNIPSVMRFRPARGCAVVLLFFLSACALLAPAPRPGRQIAMVKDLPLDTILVVGRIELRPPIGKGEQDLRTASGVDLRNVFILCAGGRLRDLAEIDAGMFEDSYLTALDQEFFIALHRMPALFLSGGAYCTRFDPPAPAE